MFRLRPLAKQPRPLGDNLTGVTPNARAVIFVADIKGKIYVPTPPRYSCVIHAQPLDSAISVCNPVEDVAHDATMA